MSGYRNSRKQFEFTRRAVVAASVFAGGLGNFVAAGPAQAQADPVSGPEAAPPEQGTLAEIVVTAQKRLERLIDTPQSVSVLSADALNRLGATIYNDATSTLYLALAAGASATVHTVQVTAGSLFELPGQNLIYTGIVTGAWAAASSGSARVTELT